MPRNPQDSHWRRVQMAMTENYQILSVAWTKITGAPTYYPLPPGTISMWPVVTPPTNAVLMDGASYLRAGTYAALFAVIGTTFGAADGTHFNVPNWIDYSPIGAGNLYTVGTAAGALTINIQHSHTLSAHTHGMAHSHQMPHTHNMANHTHTSAAHVHTLNSHVHHVNASTDNDTVQSGSGKTVSNIPHIHGNTDPSSTTDTGSTTPGVTGGPSTNVSDGTNSPNTAGAESGGIAKSVTDGPSTADTSTTGSTTQSILHPVQPAYFIIYY